MSDDEFFTARKAAAVLKHGILRRYVPVFAGKAGSQSTNGRVVVLDGYAGEGRYADGSPGSPIFMTKTARDFIAIRQIELHFVEKKAARFEKLNTVLAAEASDIIWKTYKGDVQDHLGSILTEAEDIPFFGFLDPCGLGLTFDDVVQKIFGRPSGNWKPGTEVLINFSADAVRRIGGLISKPKGSPAREATLDHMNAVCGGDWWQKMYTAAHTAERASEDIANEYFHRLTAATSAGGWVVPVKNAYNHQPKYSLIFLSRHPDGMIEFGNALSSAQGEWRRALADGDPTMSDPVYFKADEDALAGQWVATIKANLVRQLAQEPRFVLRTKYREVVGNTAGSAREMHLRAAIKQLYKEGISGFNGVTPSGGKLWDQVMFRA